MVFAIERKFFGKGTPVNYNSFKTLQITFIHQFKETQTIPKTCTVFLIWTDYEQTDGEDCL